MTVVRQLSIPVVVALVFLGLAACGRARPYRAMAKAAASEESVPAQAEDRRLKVAVREALLEEGGTGLDVTPFVYMGHAYLVGFVTSTDQADTLVRRVRAVDGVRSVDAYLPARPADRSLVNDAATKAEAKAALGLDPGQVVTRVDVEVLAGHAVLLGVVASADAAADAPTRVHDVAGVTGVTNFLLVPEPGWESLRPRLR